MNAAFMCALLGVIVAGGAGVALYLSAPRQQLRRVPMAARTSFVIVVTGVVVAIALLRGALGGAEAVYATVLVVTIVTTALPFVAVAFVKSGRGKP